MITIPLRDGRRLRVEGYPILLQWLAVSLVVHNADQGGCPTGDRWIVSAADSGIGLTSRDYPSDELAILAATGVIDRARRWGNLGRLRSSLGAA